jgi:hypothetical protein
MIQLALKALIFHGSHAEAEVRRVASMQKDATGELTSSVRMPSKIRM